MSSEPHRPSVFTPFLRRFTDETARDLADTQALYEEVRRTFFASPWADQDALPSLAIRVIDSVSPHVDLPKSERLRNALYHCLIALLSQETTIFTTPEVDWSDIVLSPTELVDLRRFLRAQQHFLANEERVVSLIISDLSSLFGGIGELFASLEGDGDGSLFTVLFIEAVENPANAIDKTIGMFQQDDTENAGLFAAVRETLYQNVCAASGMVPHQEHKKRFVYASDSSLPPRQLAETYLQGTPFLDLFLTPVPLSVPQSARFEHTHVVAGTGHGKTQTLQHFILADLKAEPPPSLVIIDSQGDMIEKISRLALFEERPQDLVIIDPRDTPALNLFDVNVNRFSRYGETWREQILNGVIELYDYLFGSLLGAELTQKQSVIFRYLARLMLTIPGATIHTLVELLSDESPYRPYIERLPQGARLFFETEFPHKSFTDTKRQIQRRLWGILENPTFEKMMSARRNQVDMFDAINSGKVVLVNTAKDFLKAERSSFLGRFFIALTLQAALERAALPESQRRSTFLYIDEAADYFDDNIDDLLTQARKYKLGVVFAHQYLDQLAPALRSSIASNTSIKFAGGVSDRDARSLAPDMRTTPSFILEQRKREKGTEFAGHIRNVTDHAISVSIPFGSLELEPKMAEAAYQELREINRMIVCEQGADTESDTPAPEKGTETQDPDNIDTDGAAWEP